MATLEMSRAVANNIFNVGKRIYMFAKPTQAIPYEPMAQASSNQNDDDHDIDGESRRTSQQQHNTSSAEAASSFLATISSKFNQLGRNTFLSTKVANSRTNLHNIDDTSTEYLVYQWLEDLFAKFQAIVLWHEPLISAYAIGTLLSSYLILGYFAPRFYGTILIALFVQNATTLWFRHIWPEIRVPPTPMAEAAERADLNRYTLIHPDLMTLKELGREFGLLMKICDHFVIERLLLLRQEKPVYFCSMVCSILYCLAILGDMISGYILVFWALTIVCIGPGVYNYLLPYRIREEIESLYQIKLFDMKQAIKMREETLRDESIKTSNVELSGLQPQTSSASGSEKPENTNSSGENQPKQTYRYLENYLNLGQQPLLDFLGLSTRKDPSQTRTDSDKVDNLDVTKTNTTNLSTPSSETISSTSPLLIETGNRDVNQDSASSVRRRDLTTTSSASSRRDSGELSSATSLIDFDDDEEDKDGFVIL